MSTVRIVLDNPHAFYTNLDFLTGKVILNLPYDESIAAVTVKLEGESRTLLRRPLVPGERRQRRDDLLMEYHKLLYKVAQVFPPTNNGQVNPAGMSYTLRAGQHAYPFTFKLPFNNSCATSPESSYGLGFGGLLLDLGPAVQSRHVTKTLPPSLTGFPNEAEIRYYVKVTVQRPSLFKENRRSQVGFKFMPIEPPSPPKTDAETFARRSHNFQPGGPPYSYKGGLFSRKKPSIPLSGSPPSVMVDARLPSPAILRCNQPVPLRIIVKTQAQSPETIFLVALQIDLIGYTNVRAQDVTRTEENRWIVMSLTGLALPIGRPNDPVGTENLLDPTLWNQIKLPPTVTPSFLTCNLTRTYELEVRVTLGFGHPGDIQPETTMLPLRFPVEVFSGIAPPAALIEAVAHRPAQPPRPPRPAAAPAYDPAYPPQVGTPGAPGLDEAPPSYEDALADDIAPVDGSRPEYSGITNENAPSEVRDEKGHGSR